MAFSQPLAFKFPGEPRLYCSSITQSTPPSAQDLIDLTVPSGKRWNMLSVTMCCRYEGIVAVRLDGALVGSGRTGPAEANLRFVWEGSLPADAGQRVLVSFTQSGGAARPIECYLHYTEEVA